MKKKNYINIDEFKPSAMIKYSNYKTQDKCFNLMSAVNRLLCLIYSYTEAPVWKIKLIKSQKYPRYINITLIYLLLINDLLRSFSPLASFIAQIKALTFTVSWLLKLTSLLACTENVRAELCQYMSKYLA